MYYLIYFSLQAYELGNISFILQIKKSILREIVIVLRSPNSTALQS